MAVNQSSQAGSFACGMDGRRKLRCHRARGRREAVDDSHGGSTLRNAGKRHGSGGTRCRELQFESRSGGTSFWPDKTRYRKTRVRNRPGTTGFLFFLLGLPARQTRNYRFEEGMEGPGYSTSITDLIPPRVLNSPLTLADNG